MTTQIKIKIKIKINVNHNRNRNRNRNHNRERLLNETLPIRSASLQNETIQIKTHLR